METGIHTATLSEFLPGTFSAGAPVSLLISLLLHISLLLVLGLLINS